MRADAIPEHLITHRKNLPALMPETSRRWCCDKQVPLFYQKDKWVCCLICKKGKTLHSIGETMNEFIKSHETGSCCKQFASVADIYAIDAPADAPVAEMPPAVQFTTMPALSTMATCHKTFGFDKVEKLMPINEQLALMCRKYEAELLRQRVAAAAPLPTRHFVEDEDLGAESERQRLALLAADEELRQRENAKPDPPRLIVKEEPKAIEKPAEVPVVPTPPLPSPVPTVKDDKPAPPPTAKPTRKLTTSKTTEPPPLPPSPPSEPEIVKKPTGAAGALMECLEYFKDFDDTSVLADHTFSDAYESARRDQREAKHPHAITDQLLDVFHSFINRGCSIKQAHAKAIALVLV
jgi:hypothetical protein